MIVNEAHSAQRVPPIRIILDRMRHDEFGGTTGKAELITGVEGASSRPVCALLPSLSGGL